MSEIAIYEKEPHPLSIGVPCACGPRSGGRRSGGHRWTSSTAVAAPAGSSLRRAERPAAADRNVVGRTGLGNRLTRHRQATTSVRYPPSVPVRTDRAAEKPRFRNWPPSSIPGPRAQRIGRSCATERPPRAATLFRDNGWEAPRLPRKPAPRRGRHPNGTRLTTERV